MFVKIPEAYEREIEKLKRKIEAGREVAKTSEAVFDVESGKRLCIEVRGKEVYLVDWRGQIFAKEELPDDVERLDEVLEVEDGEVLKEWWEFAGKVNWEDAIRACITKGSFSILEDGKVVEGFHPDHVVHVSYRITDCDDLFCEFKRDEERGVWIDEVRGKEAGKSEKDVLLYLLDKEGILAFPKAFNDVRREARKEFFNRFLLTPQGSLKL